MEDKTTSAVTHRRYLHCFMKSKPKSLSDVSPKQFSELFNYFLLLKCFCILFTLNVMLHGITDQCLQICYSTCNSTFKTS